MSERVRIDEKYEYVYDEGLVEILRHGEPWLGPSPFVGSNAWIAAAAVLEELRESLYEVDELHVVDDDGDLCSSCRVPMPCPTADAVEKVRGRL